MKKEIIAAALLIILLAGSLYNITVVDRIMSGLKAEVNEAYESAQNGDFDSAKKHIDTAIGHWLALDGYTHVFIRHTEIDSATDAFFEMQADVYDENEKALQGTYGLLIAHLDSLMTIEQVRLGSIF